MSHLLTIPFRGMEPVIVDGVYAREPDSRTSWLIDAEFDGFTMDDEELLSIFKGLIVYGHVQALGIWTAVGRRSTGPCRYDRIAVCLDLYDNVDRKIDIDEGKMTRILGRVTEALEPFGNVVVKPRESFGSALERAERIRRFAALEDEQEHHVTLRLAAGSDRDFAGLDVWDVMLSLGLEWGDMDMFHAVNRGPEGDDALFDVGTSMEPGFFWLPTLAEDTFGDLLFTMNIARTDEPEKVFYAMQACAEYARSRLGGELQGERGEPLDGEHCLGMIRELRERFAAQDAAPGDSMALFLF